MFHKISRLTRIAAILIMTCSSTLAEAHDLTDGIASSLSGFEDVPTRGELESGFGASVARAALLQIAEDTTRPTFLRARAIHLLKDINDDETTSVLARVLTRPSSFLITRSALIAASSKKDKLVHVIGSFARSDDPHLKALAINSLEKINTPKSRSLLASLGR